MEKKVTIRELFDKIFLNRDDEYSRILDLRTGLVYEIDNFEIKEDIGIISTVPLNSGKSNLSVTQNISEEIVKYRNLKGTNVVSNYSEIDYNTPFKIEFNNKLYRVNDIINHEGDTLLYFRSKIH